jgi:hypothetical protein
MGMSINMRFRKKYYIYIIISSIFILFIASIYSTKYVYRLPVFREIKISLTKSPTVEKLKILSSEKNDVPIWTFAVIGHSRSGNEAIVSPSLKKAISYCRDNKVDIVFLAGDILVGYNSNIRKYKKDVDALANYFDSMNFPIYVAPGNHDFSTKEQKEYFEKNFNKSYFHLQRDVANFLILNTSAWHEEQFNGRSFQINFDSESERGYHVLPIPGNSDKYKSIPLDQHKLFRAVIDNKIMGQPRSEDNFDIPNFFGVIMHHRQWVVKEGYWHLMWHPYLKNQNAFVFCGDHINNSEYKLFDGVHYINTSLTSNENSFVIGKFFKGEGLLLTEVNVNGNSKPIIFK